MTQIDLTHTLDHDDMKFSEGDFSSSEIIGHSFENCIFIRCNFSGAKLNKTRFISCKFVECDLSNVSLNNGRLRDTHFEFCKLIGIQWVTLDDVASPSFMECNLNYGNFVGLKMKRVSFLKCSLREVDFSESDLTESALRECDLSKARFNETNLIKADLRGAYNYVIDPLGNKIRGARFSLPEAQSLLIGLGIVIE